MTANRPTTPGVLLAGGLAQRMGGGDKSTKTVGGRSILARAIARLAPQCDGLILNANGETARFAAFGLPVVADAVAGYPGPLAGLLAGFDWIAAHRPDAAWLVSSPADCPFLPRDLVIRLHRARCEHDAQVVIAESGGQQHPVIGLWDVRLREALRHALVDEDLHGVGRWAARHRLATVTWPASPIDPFFNANTPEDLAEAERLAPLDDG